MSEPMGRRAFLRTGTAAAAGVAATASAAAQDGIDYGGWFDDVGNYDGETVDATGQEEIRITVGAQGNDGAFAFDPPAVRVDTGTRVVWEWTGEGGQHNVVETDEDGGHYASDLVSNAGTTFSLTFESEGLSRYFCDPHRALGMKGAVVAGSPEGDSTVSGAEMGQADGDGGGDGGGGDGGGASGADGNGDGAEGAGSDGDGPAVDTDTLALYGVAVVIAVLSPLAFAALLAARYRNE